MEGYIERLGLWLDFDVNMGRHGDFFPVEFIFRVCKVEQVLLIVGGHDGGVQAFKTVRSAMRKID